MGRPPCCDKSNVKRGLWTPEEDAKILAHVAIHGTGNWTLVPKKAGLNRCGKSCRLRWTNYLRPDLKHDSFTPQEEEIIIDLHQVIGSRWSVIAKQLPGRTDNDVKNYWNTKLKKKLQKLGIDPITHKPFSQIFSDIGCISWLSSQNGNHFDESTNNTSRLWQPEPSLVPSEGKNTNFTSSPSWDCMAQSQAPIQPHFSGEAAASSCSSSPSSAVTQVNSPQQSSSCQHPRAQTMPSSPFSWSEFLVCDSYLSVDLQQQQQQEAQGKISSQNEASRCSSISQIDQVASSANRVEALADAASSSSSSFVDAILSKDNEMSSQLFELLGGCFEY